MTDLEILWGSPINYTPEYLPLWLILAGLLVVATLAALALHGTLRFMLRPKEEFGAEHKLYLYTGTVRLWHWCNALLFVLLLISGVLIHFTIGPVRALMTLHEISGWMLVACWIGFVLLNAVGGNGRFYKVQWRGLIGRCFKQAYFYLIGIMKGDPHPFPATENSKFNPLQQLGYIGVMYGMVPLLLLTGIGILFPIPGFGVWIFILHQLLAIVSVMFILVHVYLCTTGDTVTQTFKSMIDGNHRHCDHK